MIDDDDLMMMICVIYDLCYIYYIYDSCLDFLWFAFITILSH